MKVLKIARSFCLYSGYLYSAALSALGAYTIGLGPWFGFCSRTALMEWSEASVVTGTLSCEPKGVNGGAKASIRTGVLNVLVTKGFHSTGKFFVSSFKAFSILRFYKCLF